MTALAGDRGGSSGPVNVPLPAGFELQLDVGTTELDETTLRGGSPLRVMRLSAQGARVWAELRRGPVGSAASGVLARRLTDAGLAHPAPPPATGSAADLTVIVPVRDRAQLLDACLRALGAVHPVLVVDDGSLDPAAVAAVADRHGATLLRRAESGGPGPARNTGLAQVRSEFVALLDSDCVPPAGWIEALVGHFADPMVAAVAPRIVPAPDSSPQPTRSGTARRLPGNDRGPVRYAVARGSLDMGARAARVVPSTRVGYVPTAALLLRRSALADAGRADAGRADAVAGGDRAGAGPAVFDPALRYGEDVDLVWRLHAAGWRIRYDPSVQVAHHEPSTWTALLARRFHYGTSAGPLALRHPGALAPLILPTWPALAVAGLLARRTDLSAAAIAAAVLTTRRRRRERGVPAGALLATALAATCRTWLGLGRYGTQFAAPLLVAVLAAPGGSGPRTRWGRRAAAASLLLGPPGLAYLRARPPLDPARFVLAHLADDIAYGAGVLAGSARARTAAPIRPVRAMSR